MLAQMAIVDPATFGKVVEMANRAGA
jgi:large subunit ribosomal protein L20